MVPKGAQFDRRCQKLLDRAHDNLGGMRFSELLRLAACLGFEPTRQRGSHVVLAAEGAEGVSLNTLIVQILSEARGAQASSASPPKSLLF